VLVVADKVDFNDAIFVVVVDFLIASTVLSGLTADVVDDDIISLT
jgi:hypothetical protein